MLEMHLRPPRLNCSACQQFSKNKEQIQKFKETGDSSYNYQNELDKPCFNMTWLIEILKICLEEQLLIKHYVINYLILLNIQNVANINEGLLQLLLKVLKKSHQVVVLKVN